MAASMASRSASRARLVAAGICLALFLPIATTTTTATAGPNHELTLPLHAVLGAHGCDVPDPCDPGPPTVNVPAGERITVYLMFRGGSDVAGVQTAFEWPGWSFQGSEWRCQSNQVHATTPTGSGGPVNGTIATAFDCVAGPATAVVGTMVFYAGQSGCLAQVESAFPFGTHVVSCTGVVDHVPPADRGSICVETGGTNACSESTSSEPPVCDAGGPYVGPLGYPLQFDGTRSYDPDGSIETYAWEFGDGATGEGPGPSHTYATIGIFTVTLCVTDEDLHQTCCTTTAEITDLNFPPVCDAGGPYTGDPGEPVTFDGRSSHDPDGTVVAYAWQFGDGATGAGATTAHTYAANGIYTVTLCVTDDDQAERCCATMATISDEVIPPVCEHGGPYDGQQGQPVTFDGRASHDPDGTIAAYAWQFGDGATGHGPITFHTYADTSGTFQVTLCVTDDDDAQSCCQTTAAIAEPPPPNDADIGFVLHAVVTDFGPCEPATPPCPLPTTTVQVGEQVAVYFVVDHFESLAGVQVAFAFGPFDFLYGLWDCQLNQVAGTVPAPPGGPTNGTLATAFDCITGVGTAVIGRMQCIPQGPGCITLPQSSFPFGNHVVDCNGVVTQITAPTCLGSVCAGTLGVNACGPCQATVVEPASWGAIKRRYRD